MSTLNLKLYRDIKHNWHMLLAVSAIMAIGIGCFVGMMATKQNLALAKDNYYATSRMADFWVDLKKAPAQNIQSVINTKGVSEVRDRIKYQVMLSLAHEEKPISALLLSLPDIRKPIINDIVIRQGTYFTQGRPNEVILSEKFAKARQIKPGDTITAILNDKKKKLIVVGTAISAEFVYLTPPGGMIDDPNNYGLLYVKRSFAERIYGFDNVFNNVIGLLSPKAKIKAKAITKDLARKLAPFGVFSSMPRSEQLSNIVITGEMQQLASLAVVFPLFFLSVSALILNVLMVRLTTQQRTIIGTLKAIGYGNRELLWHFLELSAVTGLIGGLLGIMLGRWISQSFSTMYLQYFNFPKLSNHFYPDIYMMGICFSLLFAFLGTIKGVKKVMRLAPAEAMRQAPPTSGKKVWIENIKAFWAHLDTQWQMMVRNLMRNKGRTLVTLFSAAMGSSIVVIAFGFVDSMDGMVNTQFKSILHSHYHLTFNKELDGETLAAIKRLPGVTRAEPVYTVACTFTHQNHSKRGAILGISANSELTTPIDKAGNAIQIPKTGLLMPYRLMNKLHVKAGDYIDMTPVKGTRRTRHIAIAHGVESLLGLTVYANETWLNKMMGSHVINEARVLTHFNQKQKRQFLKELRQMPSLQTLTDLKTQENLLNVQMDSTMRGMAFVMILFAAFIFFGAILDSTLISLSERKREIATFRTMGYFQSEVAKVFLRENLVTNILGTLIGLPLGKWMTHEFIKGLTSDAYSFPAVLTTMSYIYTVLLAICFVYLSQIVVNRKIKKLNWVEAMSLKE